MNLLLITSRSDLGGGPRHVYDLINNLSSEFQLTVASPKSEPYYKEFVKGNYLYIPHRSFSIYYFLKVLTFCKDQNVNLIHTHGRGASVYGFCLSLWGFKIVHTFHGVHLPKNYTDKIKSFIDRLISRSFREIIFVSQSEKGHAELLNYGFNIHNSVIPNGVSIEEISQKYLNYNKEQLQEAWQLPRDKSIIGTLSRLDPHKNNFKLIEWMQDLPEKYILLIAGEGEERSILESLIIRLNLKNRVFLLGSVSDPIKFLKIIDVFVSLSKGEGLPYSILEALAVKKPILLSKVSGHIDLVHEDFLFSSKEEFLCKIISLKNVELKLNSKFNLVEMINKIESIYLKMN